MNEQNVRVDADDLKRVVLEVLDDMKAQDVRVLDVRRLTDVTDAMIIASALQLGCQTIWSEDLNPGQDYDQVKVLSPF